jgi:hypothetical protein
MNNRICIQEEILSEYLCGVLPPEDRVSVEKHLASCGDCRKLLSEAHAILSGPDLYEMKDRILKWALKNIWILGAVILFFLSFLFTKHFFQLLAASIIMAAKWIIDSRATRMLVMIHDAWKRGDNASTDELLSRLDPKD